MPQNLELRTFVDLRNVLQKQRIAMGLRIDAMNRGADELNAQAQDLFLHYHERFATLEADVTNTITNIAADIPIIEHIIKVKGISYLTAAKVVALIDITRSDTISQLWRYAGYGIRPDTGTRDRPTKGEPLVYNKRLKTTLYNVASGFLKANSPYRQEYDESKDYYQANRPDWVKAHIHMASQRKMIKLFLSHLWLQWRTIEGLPVSDPYIIAANNNGHNRIKTPQDYGWPTMEEMQA